MNQPENLHIINACPIREFATAIDLWLVALSAYVMERNDETEYDYNAAYFKLGEAFNKREQKADDTPGAFERDRCGLVAPGTD